MPAVFLFRIQNTSLNLNENHSPSPFLLFYLQFHCEVLLLMLAMFLFVQNTCLNLNENHGVFLWTFHVPFETGSPAEISMLL